MLGALPACRDVFDCKRKLLRLLDSMHPWCRSAFYADSDVSRIVDALYSRMEASGGDMPVDYASLEELRLLLEKAEYYAKLPPWKAFQLAMSRSDEE